MANLPSKITPILTRTIDITGITGIIEKYIEYKKTIEQARTERELIQAKRDILVSEMRMRRELILDYFEKRFCERKMALNKFFSMLDEGVNSKDERLLHIALTGIVGIIRENPLGDFETFKRNMLQENYVIEL